MGSLTLVRVCFMFQFQFTFFRLRDEPFEELFSSYYECHAGAFPQLFTFNHSISFKNRNHHLVATLLMPSELVQEKISCLLAAQQ